MPYPFPAQPFPDPDVVANDPDHPETSELMAERYQQEVEAGKYYNYVLQDALDDASDRGIRTVRGVHPAVHVYDVTALTRMPVETRLLGWGAGTSNAPYAKHALSKLNVTGAFANVLQMSSLCVIDGWEIDGNDLADGGILSTGEDYDPNASLADHGTITPWILNCFIHHLDYGVRMSGAIFGGMKRTAFNSIDQWSMYNSDAAAHADLYYYGWQHFVTESNEFKGDVGLVANDGIWTSIADDFETTFNTGSDYAITVGLTVQSQAMLFSPYFEMTGGTASIKGVKVANSCKLVMMGGQAIGEVADTGAIFLYSDVAASLVVHGMDIARFYTVYDGSVIGTSVVSLIGNRYSNYNVINSLTGIATCASSIVTLPGTHLGDT